MRRPLRHSDAKAIIRTRIFATEPTGREELPDRSGRLSLVRGKTYELRLEVELKQDGLARPADLRPALRRGTGSPASARRRVGIRRCPR